MVVNKMVNNVKDFISEGKSSLPFLTLYSVKGHNKSPLQSISQDYFA